MQSDPIVDEIRGLREQRAARFGFDIETIVRDAQERDATADCEIVRRPPRRPLSLAYQEREARTVRVPSVIACEDSPSARNRAQPQPGNRDGHVLPLEAVR